MVQNHLKSLPSFFIDPCYRTIYKMVQFYETYSAGSFIELVKQYGMQHFLPGNSGMKFPSNENTIVPIELAQIPTVLFSTGWSNHQLIMSQCKTNEQRLFYILYSGHEQLEYKICQEPVPSGIPSAFDHLTV